MRQRKESKRISQNGDKLNGHHEKDKTPAPSGWRLFSDNPDKAWAEKMFFAYSPVWPVLFGLWGVSGWHLEAGDTGNMLVTCLIASPNILIPLLFCPRQPGVGIGQTYWFKFSVWIAIYAFCASYFFTEYFFDALGMIYDFPHLKWNFDSVLLGSGTQVVPLMMYFHAWYFFMTYHTCSVMFIRAIRTCPWLTGIPFINSLAVAFTAWLFSWGEIYATTLEAIRDQFRYKDMNWALSYGAAIYCCYFIVSFPMVYNLDESRTKERWSLWYTAQNALAASMLSFIILDLVCQYVITGWSV